eukprot:PhF_6_TR3374/c0_g2_i14/m.4814
MSFRRLLCSGACSNRLKKHAAPKQECATPWVTDSTSWIRRRINQHLLHSHAHNQSTLLQPLGRKILYALSHQEPVKDVTTLQSTVSKPQVGSLQVPKVDLTDSDIAMIIRELKAFENNFTQHLDASDKKLTKQLDDFNKDIREHMDDFNKDIHEHMDDFNKDIREQLDDFNKDI